MLPERNHSGSRQGGAVLPGVPEDRPEHPSNDDIALTEGKLATMAPDAFAEQPKMAGAGVCEVSAEDSQKLFKWNAGLAALHLLTGIVILIITDQDATAPVYTFFPDADTRGISDNWAPSAHRLGDFPVGVWSGISLLLSGLNHLVVCTVARRQYEWYLARNRNPIRWIEYSVSAACMRVMIGQLSGVFSLHVLLALFGFTAVTMIFGNEQEVLNTHRPGEHQVTWRPFFFGWIPHMCGWMINLIYFFQGVTHGDPPGFVYAIIFILFFFDATFPIVMYLQQRGRGKWANYLRGEVWFCILSLVSKQLLAWINWGGTNSLNNDA